MSEIIIPGKNCWRKDMATRIAFLIDAAEYFKAFTQAVNRAKNTVFILGWDIDSRVSLLRRNQTEFERSELRTFLNDAVTSKPDLRIHILIWNYSFFFLFDREFFSSLKLNRFTHERIQFRMDSAHPFGGSHHQKIVVVDDSLAFVGGLDLTRSRWDTPEHKSHDPNRIDPNGDHYKAFHDVQIMADGPTAESLGNVFRERWLRATGEQLPPPKGTRNVWPEGFNPDLRDINVAIARTIPAGHGTSEIREVESLYGDAIASAENFIYIENQYLTSCYFARALQKRLHRPDCPEIIIVMPHKSSGRIEKRTMDVLRGCIVDVLRASDKYDKLRIYYPVLMGMPESDMLIHSKVMVVDDKFLRIGSSNLTNRSMALDTECDLALEEQEDPEIRNRIAKFRNRLLGEHLGIEPELLRIHLNQSKSLIKTIEHFLSDKRTLKLLSPEYPDPGMLMPVLSLVDPASPLSSDVVMNTLIPDELKAHSVRNYVKTGLIIVLLAGLFSAWQWGPLGKWINTETLAIWGGFLTETSAAPLFVPLAYILGTVLMMPLTIMIGATAIVFDPRSAAVYALAGTLSSAVVTYFIGRAVKRETVLKLAGAHGQRITLFLSTRGFMTIAVFRLVPLAPFPIANLMMGAFGTRFFHFVLGTLIGIIPGILAVTLFAGTLMNTFRQPSLRNLLIVFLTVFGVILLFRWTKKRFFQVKFELCNGAITRQGGSNDG